MLFLGAGASKAAGIGDMDDLTNLIIEMINENLREKIISIQRILNLNQERNNFHFNLEIIYSLLEGLANKNSLTSELGPYPQFMDNLLRNKVIYNDLSITNEEFYNFKETTNEIIVETIRSYERDNERKNLAKDLYDELFRIQFRHLTQFRDAQGGNVNNVFHVCATLNYDQVLELYDDQTFHSRESPIKPHFSTSRGFDNDRNSRIHKLDLRRILSGEKQVEYIKLHGSTDWWIDEHNNIIESFSQDNPFTNLIDRQIIYPIYEKYISKEPFFTLYQYFRKRLLEENIIIVIGYSFADISINNAFSDWLTDNIRARLIVTAREDRHNLIRDSLSFGSNRIEFINDYFGETNFISNLTNLLTRQ
jgi:hypothetical protein